MSQSRLLSTRKARWLVAAMVAASAVAPLASQGAAFADTTGKTFTFSMSQSSTPGPTDSGAYTGRLTNTSDPGPGHQLGAANVWYTPSDAFYSVTLDGVSVSPAGSTTPTLSYDSTGFHLRNLDAAPGAVVTFRFHAAALQGETVQWFAKAKQSNDFRGLNNDVIQTNTSTPITTTVSGSCGGVTGPFDAASCQGIPIATGGTACTGDVTSQNTDSTITACTTLPPVPGAVGVQLLEQVTELNVVNCALNVLACAWTWEELQKYSTYYDSAHTITVTIYCGDQCGLVGTYLQQNTSGGNPELLPPCFPVAVPSLSGSTACYTPGSGKIVITGVTHVNDYKVMLPNGTTIGN